MIIKLDYNTSDDKYKNLKEHIASIFEPNRRYYGYRRIYMPIKTEGIHVSEKAVHKRKK